MQTGPAAEHNQKLPSTPSAILGRHDFDTLLPPQNSRLSLRRAGLSDIPDALALAHKTIGGNIAEAGDIARVIARNAENISMIHKDNRSVGVCALLMLRAQGLEALLLGEFIPQKPDLKFLVQQNEIPVAIYVWAIIAPGLASAGIRHMGQFLQQPKFANANLYSRPATPDGARMMMSTGFTRVQSSTLDLYRYVRLANRTAGFAAVA
jgi:hypothetical protein